jgi:hypothetical protein
MIALIWLGQALCVIAIVYGSWRFGYRAGVNDTMVTYHAGYAGNRMERRDPDAQWVMDMTGLSTPNRRFIDKYRPGGTYERTKIGR